MTAAELIWQLLEFPAHAIVYVDEGGNGWQTVAHALELSPDEPPAVGLVP